MDYKLFNEQVREIKESLFRKDELFPYKDMSYHYLEEGLYAVKRDGEDEIVLVRANNPFDALATDMSRNYQKHVTFAFSLIISSLKILGIKKITTVKNNIDSNKTNIPIKQMESIGFVEPIGDTFYRLTDEGIDNLEEMLGVKIEVEE